MKIQYVHDLHVVTHHVPSFQLSSPDFKNSRNNGAFTVELSDYIETSPVKYWIFGHSHRNIDKTIGKTRCVTNQLGYVSHNEHLTFSPEKIIGSTLFCVESYPNRHGKTGLLS